MFKKQSVRELLSYALFFRKLAVKPLDVYPKTFANTML
jgi:hypothetical protein